jgi:hypothetical protein
MNRYVSNTSTIIALVILAASGFTAYPTLASGFYHLFIIFPLLFVHQLFSHVEGYRQARDDYAPGQSIKGRILYRFVEWVETPHLGVRGIWIVLMVIMTLSIYVHFK